MMNSGRLVRTLCTLVAILVLAGSSPARAESVAVTIDGRFEDWPAESLVYQDPSGDGPPGGVDFGRLWMADDLDFLFLRFEVGDNEFDLSENNSLRIYLDTDLNSATGLAVAGIGAELEWRAGSRSGTFYHGGQQWTVDQADLRFRGAPTVTATQFEIALGRAALPNGTDPLFTGTGVRVVLHDTAGGDQLPDSPAIVQFTFDQGQLPPEIVIPIERDDPDDVRLITYNVWNDAPWNAGQEPRFGRQLAAVAPDILCFQEIYSHSSAQTAELVERWVSPGAGGSWHHVGNSDCKVISRYPILDSWALDGNIAVLIDTGDVWTQPLLLINAHLPCCSNDSGRQWELDRIMAFIRDAREPGGELELPADSPIIITGDLNLVGLLQQLTTLLTGDIVNEGSFGPDFAPDWDGSDLANVIARQTELRMGYTWRSDGSSFWPGQLDYIVHSDAVIELGHDFILYTPEMSPENLTAYGLQSGDSQASDHLLFCADFRPATTAGDMNCDGVVDFGDVNPFVLALTDQAAYEAAYPGCTWHNADVNDDGEVDFGDINPFVALLVG